MLNSFATRKSGDLIYGFNSNTNQCLLACLPPLPDLKYVCSLLKTSQDRFIVETNQWDFDAKTRYGNTSTELKIYAADFDDFIFGYGLANYVYPSHPNYSQVMKDISKAAILWVAKNQKYIHFLLTGVWMPYVLLKNAPSERAVKNKEDVITYSELRFIYRNSEVWPNIVFWQGQNSLNRVAPPWEQENQKVMPVFNEEVEKQEGPKHGVAPLTEEERNRKINSQSLWQEYQRRSKSFQTKLAKLQEIQNYLESFYQIILTPDFYNNIRCELPMEKLIIYKGIKHLRHDPRSALTIETEKYLHHYFLERLQYFERLNQDAKSYSCYYPMKANYYLLGYKTQMEENPKALLLEQWKAALNFENCRILKEALNEISPPHFNLNFQEILQQKKAIVLTTPKV